MTPVLGLFLLGFGIACAVRPYEIARFEERMDSIGSKRRWSEVEPAGWKVTLTRATGIGFALFGALVLFEI